MKTPCKETVRLRELRKTWLRGETFLKDTKKPARQKS